MSHDGGGWIIPDISLMIGREEKPIANVESFNVPVGIMPTGGGFDSDNPSTYIFDMDYAELTGTDWSDLVKTKK